MTFAVFAAHFQDEISAHRVAHEKNFLEAIAVGELFADGAIVGAHAGAVECGSELFAAAAVALIYADGMKALFEGCLGDAARVVGAAGALEAVDDDDDRGGGARAGLATPISE